MKRLLTGAVLAAACLACSGCLVVATAAAVGALVISTKPTGKTTTKAPNAAVETTGQPVPVSAVPVTPGVRSELTAESAASLAQPGKVVVVDVDSGTRTALTWQEGMTLAAAAATGKADSHHSAQIFRGTRVLPADLRQDWTRSLGLLSGDVVELRR